MSKKKGPLAMIILATCRIFMKTIKKIVLGTPFKADEMNHLKGGDNINDAIWCTCSGNDNTRDCHDNTNESFACTCYGSSTDNSNSNLICNCGK